MIKQSIKIHEETKTYYSSQSYSHTPYSNMSPEQRKAWEAEVDLARESAKAIFNVGDKVNLKTGNQIIVTGFVEDIKEVIRAQGDPCIIFGVGLNWKTCHPVRYAISECNLDTHIPAEPIIDIKSIEDETNEIPN